MLKVVVDATPLLPKPSGVGFYVANLIQALHALQDQENFQLGIAYQPSLKNWFRGNLRFPDSIQQYPNLHLIPLPVRVLNLLATVPNPLLSYFEQSFELPDIVHGTNYAVYPCQKSLRVMSIYDLTFIKYPNYVNAIVRSYASRIQQCLRWTDLVLTISESSKQDIVEHLNISPSRVQVTPLASRYHTNYLSEEMVEKLSHSINYDFSKPYILFVSTIEPRKNINVLIGAFNLLKQKHKIEHHLILIGQKGWHYKPIFAEIERSPWNHCIHHLNYLSDELVALFYSKADVFVYPSHYEGFGLPVLEAMTLETPVITSNTSSLPEVAGDAALLVDPNDVADIANAILRVVGDRTLRQELIRKGKEQAKLYSWERTAHETLRAYRSLLV
ncbi:glycosyltransferase family 4 protein [Leptolyngbya sp. FACHB-541]|uniref:glycosyltransferase family 4 protein n=1 Tax=Leptolyngbya sp. FACHB-541 TaxID=2692810 RepID=UPI00168353BE|nr:glycosyltransferase family 1 protein [Leptolyngbya sp. FACHB-541]MBD1999472.1 glycosyltransferase family 4 protein [Leptolyngbya sp. FACHB-541]